MRFLSSLQADPEEGTRLNRRGFLGFGGTALAATALVASGCDSSDDNNSDVRLDFSNDFGVLNYAYALEQLEAAFYAQVIATPFAGIAANETAILSDLAAHERIHRDFLAAALGTNAIPGLTPNFTAINFGSRTSVLTTAKTFEDLGVSAYNGAGRYLSLDAYITVAGKIVSVEARHAAVIRDLLEPNTNAFARLGELAAFGAVAANGLDGALAPDKVLAQASGFIREKITARNF